MATQDLSLIRDCRFWGELNFSSADVITWKSNSIPGSALLAAADIARSQLAKNASTARVIPLDHWLVSATLAKLGTAAGTPSGAFGLTPGVHGTNTPKLIGEAANANSKTNTARTLISLPGNYATAQAVALKVRARITGDVQVAQTLDLTAFESDQEAGVSADLYEGAALVLTNAWAWYTFTINPANLDTSSSLDLALVGVANDTGGTANKLIEIGHTELHTTNYG